MNQMNLDQTSTTNL